jgi:hypothetical protein
MTFVTPYHTQKLRFRRKRTACAAFDVDNSVSPNSSPCCGDSSAAGKWTVLIGHGMCGSIKSGVWMGGGNICTIEITTGQSSRVSDFSNE